jgi:hypothetical protein
VSHEGLEASSANLTIVGGVQSLDCLAATLRSIRRALIPKATAGYIDILGEQSESHQARQICKYWLLAPADRRLSAKAPAFAPMRKVWLVDVKTNL